MYDIKTDAQLSINSKLLLDSDEESLAMLLRHLEINPDSLREMIKNIQEWYKKQPHLPEIQLHDQFIVRLLIMRKFSLEKVKEKIDKFYTVRNKIPELLSERDPMAPKVNTYLKNGYLIIFPQKTTDNHRITLFRIKSSDGITIIDLNKINFMIAEYRLWNDTAMGEHLVLDFENVTTSLIMQMTPMLISKIVYYVTSCLAPKLKGVHLIHLPIHAAAALSMFKKLLKPKLVERIHVYNSLEEVMKKFSPNIIPRDLGGTYELTCKEITDAWLETLSSPAWRNYFLEQDFIRSDEAKRTNGTLSNDQFGIEGSFKKLNID